jgi:hypothetical protein
VEYLWFYTMIVTAGTVVVSAFALITAAVYAGTLAFDRNKPKTALALLFSAILAALVWVPLALTGNEYARDQYEQLTTQKETP